VQILIDTDDTPTVELAAAINMLNDILQSRRTPVEAPAVNEEQERAKAPPPPLAAPPPPPAFGLASIVSEDDPEVTIDDEGNVSAVTATVSLPVAPPPPAVLAPAIPAPVPPPPGPAVPAELDNRGYPWDGRIHASNRAKKIDGSWKNKRGVDPNLIVACEAQNKPGNAPVALAHGLAAAPAVSAATTASAPSTSPPPSIPAAFAPAATPPPALTVGTVAPAAGVPSPPIDFRGLMQKIQAATAAGKITTAQINEALASVGLRPEEMAQLISNAPLIASVNAAVDKCLGS
jgi:hypothetical protein